MYPCGAFDLIGNFFGNNNMDFCSGLASSDTFSGQRSHTLEVKIIQSLTPCSTHSHHIRP